MKRIICGMSVVVFCYSAHAYKKEVTEDMLVGSWECTCTNSKTVDYDDNGNVIDNEENKKLGKMSFPSYKKHTKGMLIATILGIDHPPYDFKVKDDGSFLPVFHDGTVEGGLEARFAHEYVFISNNKYELINEIFFRENITKKIIRKTHTEWFCKKVIE